MEFYHDTLIPFLKGNLQPLLEIQKLTANMKAYIFLRPWKFYAQIANAFLTTADGVSRIAMIALICLVSIQVGDYTLVGAELSGRPGQGTKAFPSTSQEV